MEINLEQFREENKSLYAQIELFENFSDDELYNYLYKDIKKYENTKTDLDGKLNSEILRNLLSCFITIDSDNIFSDEMATCCEIDTILENTDENLDFENIIGSFFDYSDGGSCCPSFGNLEDKDLEDNNLEDNNFVTKNLRNDICVSFKKEIVHVELNDQINKVNKTRVQDLICHSTMIEYIKEYGNRIDLIVAIATLTSGFIGVFSSIAGAILIVRHGLMEFCNIK